jgi:hypothetical protein
MLFVAVTPAPPMRFLLRAFANDLLNGLCAASVTRRRATPGGWIWLAIASPKNKSDHFGCDLTI